MELAGFICTFVLMSALIVLVILEERAIVQYALCVLFLLLRFALCE
jgi:hypothetical protein